MRIGSLNSVWDMYTTSKKTTNQATNIPDFLNPTMHRGHTDEEKQKMIDDASKTHMAGFYIDGEMIYFHTDRKGTKDITQDQIDSIRERYDLDNLSRDNKDKLLAELIELDIVSSNVFNRLQEDFEISHPYTYGKPTDFDDIINLGDWIEYFMRKKESAVIDIPIYAKGELQPAFDHFQHISDMNKLNTTMLKIQNGSTE